MNKFLEKLGQILKKIQIFLFFLISIAIAVYLFPTERKFKYEYQKGKPWEHADLTARFSFPVYKSQGEISIEKDSVLKGYRPYFKLDTTVSDKMIDQFEVSAYRLWQDFEKTVDIKNTLSRRQKNNLIELGDSSIFIVKETLEEIYNNGIVEVGESYETAIDNDNAIMVIHNNMAEEYDSDEVYTPKSAYQHLINEIDQFIERKSVKSNILQNEFFSKLEIHEFINSNIIFDASTSMKIQQELIEGISLYKGAVQKGEIVISRGDIVGDQEYRILESLRREYENRTGGELSTRLILVGRAILVLGAFLMLYFYLANFRPTIMESPKKVLFLLFITIIVLLTFSLVIQYEIDNVYFIPVLILPIIIRTFYDGHVALFFHMITVLLIGFFVPNPFEFIFLSFISAVVSVISLRSSNSRAKLIYTAILAVVSYSIVYFGYSIIQEGKIEDIEWHNFGWFGLNGLLILIAYPLIYVFEKIFGFLSDATLLELSDTNQPLLRKMAEEAPATFQHSLQVANLAESAAAEIGANPLLARTGALYHDIGKMKDAIFFVENQSDGFNPHDGMEFDQSAKKIIDHVTRGVEIAKKNNLPEPIIDFIRMHHGTSTVQYFYRNFIKQHPEKEGEVEKFQYPGPRPMTKETAILMMVDTIEAASRSLKEVNNQSISDLVEKLVGQQMEEKQFEDADLTFREIRIVKEVFKRKLRDIYHARIAYPEKEKK